MSEPSETPVTLFTLQHWCQPRTITGEGEWDWDMGQLFGSLNEAETYQAEFSSEKLTRIVRMELVEREVIETHDGRDIKQAKLFKTTDV